MFADIARRNREWTRAGRRGRTPGNGWQAVYVRRYPLWREGCKGTDEPSEIGASRATRRESAMASGRPDTFGGGGNGGFLDGETVAFTGYTWEMGELTESQYGPFAKLNLIPEFTRDGASEPVTRRLFVGNGAKFDGISEDGRTLYLGKGKLSGKSEAGAFIATLFAKDASSKAYPAVEGEANYEFFLGKRLTLARVENPARKPETGKDGNTYPGRDLLVDAVIEAPKRQMAGSPVSEARPQALWEACSRR